MVSSFTEESYQADLVRIICADDLSDLNMFKEELVEASFSGVHPGCKKTIATGSYIEINSDAVIDQLECFTVQALVFPTLISDAAKNYMNSMLELPSMKKWFLQSVEADKVLPRSEVGKE